VTVFALLSASRVKRLRLSTNHNLHRFLLDVTITSRPIHTTDTTVTTHFSITTKDIDHVHRSTLQPRNPETGPQSHHTGKHQLGRQER
jgi:hypothetical protein